MVQLFCTLRLPTVDDARASYALRQLHFRGRFCRFFAPVVVVCFLLCLLFDFYTVNCNGKGRVGTRN